jgi:adenylate cyclase
MKVNIKVSILSLFAILMLLVSGVLMGLDYYASNNLIVNSATSIMDYSSQVIESNISAFLIPVLHRTEIGATLIEKKVINPEDSALFTSVLIKGLTTMPDFSAIYWSDIKGETFSIERANGAAAYAREIIHAKQHTVTSTLLDGNGNPIATPKVATTNFDARNRIWYIKAQRSGRCIFSDAYLFYPFGENQEVLGVSYACPVYDNNQLRGMFVMDMRLSAFSDFISKMHITPNAQIFIFDDEQNLIAANRFSYQNQKTLTKISDLHLPWIENSLNQFYLRAINSFRYKHGKDDYLALYKKLFSFEGNDWNIGILVPMNDILSTLHTHTLITASIAFFTLFLGLFFVYLASLALSRPIVKLADEAELIRQLDVTFVSTLKSHIKEIVHMQEAFYAMKKSLQSFARYVPITLVRHLVNSGDLAHVGGESKQITFLFSDITGFTSLSENMDPQNLMTYLSEYFESMTKIILRHGGTVDKYIGDAIMAFWNAPLDDPEHAKHACECALDMNEEIAVLNQHLEAIGRPQISVRIGINTGNAVIGNVGSVERLSYTAIGDSVNVSNRIEELNKVYKTRIIISESTYELVKSFAICRMIDHVYLRGKVRGSCLYELLPINNHFGVWLDDYNAAFRLAFDLYRQKQWDKAIAAFQELASRFTFDTVAKVFVERCAYLKDNPQADWNGTWRFQ